MRRLISLLVSSPNLELISVESEEEFFEVGQDANEGVASIYTVLFTSFFIDSGFRQCNGGGSLNLMVSVYL